jgi:hypothetical protein
MKTLKRRDADLTKMNGIGTMARAKKPSNDEAHLGFKALYICVANNCKVSNQSPGGSSVAGDRYTGKTAPKMLRTTVFPAKAEAAIARYVSMI